MYFSKPNLISIRAVCLWLWNYQNSAATPCALTFRFTGTELWVRFRGNMVLFLSSVLWQQSFLTVKLHSNSVVCSFFPPSLLCSSDPQAFLLSSMHLLFFLVFSLHIHSLPRLFLPGSQYARSQDHWGHEGICVPRPLWGSVRLV